MKPHPARAPVPVDQQEFDAALDRPLDLPVDQLGVAFLVVAEQRTALRRGLDDRIPPAGAGPAREVERAELDVAGVGRRRLRHVIGLRQPEVRQKLKRAAIRLRRGVRPLQADGKLPFDRSVGFQRKPAVAAVVRTDGRQLPPRLILRGDPDARRKRQLRNLKVAGALPALVLEADHKLARPLPDPVERLAHPGPVEADGGLAFRKIRKTHGSDFHLRTRRIGRQKVGRVNFRIVRVDIAEVEVVTVEFPVGDQHDAPAGPLPPDPVQKKLRALAAAGGHFDDQVFPGRMQRSGPARQTRRLRRRHDPHRTVRRQRRSGIRFKAVQKFPPAPSHCILLHKAPSNDYFSARARPGRRLLTKLR